MKIQSIVSLLVLTFILAGGAVGCKKKLQRTTPLPGRTGAGIEGDGIVGLDEGLGTVPPMGDGLGDSTDLMSENAFDGEGNAALGDVNYDGWREDHGTLSAETVYFDFDKSNVRTSEVGKIENVAEIFRSMPIATKALRIEGHCDERGTAEYNRALGERRALSIREYLITLGIDPARIDTRSYGEDQPANPEQNEAAYAENRRGVFVVLTAPGAE